MKKKILSTLLAGAAVATMGMTTAQAAVLDNIGGDIVFKFIGYDAAQISYDTSGTADGAFLCTTAVGCDAASVPSAAPGAIGDDDTYGMGRVNSIVDLNTFGNVWSDGTDGDVLLAYFNGFRDEAVQRVSATSTQIFSTGGTVDIFRIDAATYASIDLTDQATIEGDLAGLAGDLYLSIDFMPGCDAIETYATLCGDFDLTTSTGNSSGFAKAVGGAALAKYPFDFFFTQDVVPCDTQPACSGSGTSFNIFIRGGEATTTALPEPASLGLLGLGLVGLGLVARRRKAA